MSTHGVDLGHSVVVTASRPGSLMARINRAMAVLNKAIVVICSTALIVASTILSYSVAARYFFNAATYWQDEAAGAKVHDLDEAIVQKWRELARETAWKDYANKNENCARLLKLAVETGA